MPMLLPAFVRLPVAQQHKQKVTRYRKIKAKGKESFQLVLETTPFYAESGGQVSDTGTLTFNFTEKLQVTDTRKER